MKILSTPVTGYLYPNMFRIIWFVLINIVCLGNTFASSSGYGLDNQRKSLSTNWGNLCYIRDGDKQVVCRGEDQWDDISDGEDIHVVGISNARSIAVEAGEFDDQGGIWGCAVDGAGDVYCWIFRLPVYKIENIDDAVSVVLGSGSDFGCAVRSNGNVKCWGDNDDGQLGNGTIDDSLVAVDVQNVSGIVALTTGTGYSSVLGRNAHWVCGIRYTGGVRCWGGGYSAAFAVSNVDSVRQIAITGNKVCLLREGTPSTVACADTEDKQFANFANYTSRSDLMYTTNMASDHVFGLQCFSRTVSEEWECRQLGYGFGSNVGPGFMTTLPTDVRALVLEDGSVSCAINNDWSLSCMYHGALQPYYACDVAELGEDCFLDDIVNNYFGEIGITTPVPGVWYTVPNAVLYESGEPTIFDKPTSLSRDSGTQSSIRVSWNQGSSASSSFEVRYRKQGTEVWLTGNGTQTKNGERITTTITGLQANTQYQVRVRGRTWGSKTNYSSIFTASTL
jgi:Fibronectin type III domain/Regulator of chromosome condensation (RCC1) repeat